MPGKLIRWTALMASAILIGCSNPSGVATRSTHPSSGSEEASPIDVQPTDHSAATQPGASWATVKSALVDPYRDYLLGRDRIPKEVAEKVVVDVADATSFIKAHPTLLSYHLLFFLREYAPEAYRDLPAATKAAVLCSALANGGDYNDWGDLRAGRDETAGIALVELGESAIPFLRKILADFRRAGMFGSFDSTNAETLHYRRCDYAYRYLMLALGRKPTFPEDVADRDKLIRALQLELEQKN